MKLQNMKDNKTIRKAIVLVGLGCGNTTTDWVTYEKQVFIFLLGSLKSGGWKSQIRVPERLSKGPLPHHRFLLTWWKAARDLSRFSFIRTRIPLMRVPPS